MKSGMGEKPFDRPRQGELRATWMGLYSLQWVRSFAGLIRYQKGAASYSRV